ncbi:ABC-F family ATP-binding cassette domain-containing protein [Ornithinimicrobium cryptoxanthini]|uniref:ATP-binding cassette domain-containing protein n=1 Tax=Ornithinimicrobium cryptoxanthini TaxID=2934161 RepID=A0ABY4YM33_9MICO|nr:ABC-F family ATP-binding cassette domain-containing protein [Ornithinimicrobium cryptoxanthini]USQ77217.1 ATP-binding cassette domain-containing protein [Ornithinimicrobium cryptoxanthini]
MTPPLHSAALSAADHLRVDGVSRSFPDRRVLTDVSFTVSSGEIAALIGENGSGKSTLLRIAAGVDEPDVGSVSAPGSVGLFHQEPPFALDLTIEEVLADATGPVRALVQQVEDAGQGLADGRPGADTRLHAAIDAADRHHAWELDHRVGRVCDGLGLAHLLRDRRVRELSGGQVSRLSLAWFLLRSPDTLLLDEPTNHLDDAATAVLVDLLRGWSGPVLLASHDRAFLDEVGTTLLDLDPTPRPFATVRHDTDSPGSGFGITKFTGSYTAYLRQRQEERERWVHRFRDEQAELTRLRVRARDDHIVGRPDRPPRTEGRAAKKFYADRNAKVVARRVNDATTALERLEREQVRKPPARLRFVGLGGDTAGEGRTPTLGDSTASSSGPLLTATGLAVAGRLAPTTLSLHARSRLLVTGPNGSGKSTLLSVLAGDVAPDHGSLTAPRRLRIALLSQEPLHRDPTESVRSAYAAAVGQERAERTPLATFGLIAGRDANRPVGALSVGQRRRLDLAILLADPPDVLVLDEPTNHLSLLLVTELERSLPDYPGAVIVASHDRWLRDSWAGERLALEGTA